MDKEIYTKDVVQATSYLLVFVTQIVYRFQNSIFMTNQLNISLDFWHYAIDNEKPVPGYFYLLV